MNRDVLLQRAQLLMSQSRPEQAAEQLRQVLASDPNDVDAHAMLSLCLSHNEDSWHDATREAEQAIHLAPDFPTSHYAMAVVLANRNRFPEASQAIEEALRLDPYQPEFYRLAGSIQAQQQQWQKALDFASEALSIDPDDEGCSAIRSLALERLGRTHDALQEADAAVSRNPDSAEAHAMRGWAQLQSGDHKAAQESFREALRLEPTYEFARSGMIQSLNNNYLLFRIIHRFYTFIGRMAAQAQWALIIGLFVGMRLLRGLARQYPALQPYVTPISLLYLGFCLLSWIADPLFNTFLRFHSFGKYLLTEKQKWASNLVAASLALGVVGLIFRLSVGDFNGATILLLCSFFMALPLATAFSVDRGWPQMVATGAAVILGLLYLATAADICFALDLGIPFGLFLIGILVFSFGANWLKSATVRH